jgi:hypothetical protein
MILYVNGDSHCYGANLKLHERFSDIVAEEFNSTLINVAQLGISNPSILRTTREYLATQPPPDLVLIGWTTWEREEWKYKDQYYNVNSSGYDHLADELQEMYKDWVTKQTSETLIEKSQYWHEQIYQFHLELKQQNIKHLFFNCMYNFFQPYQQYNWDYRFIEPYNNDASYYWWLNNQGFIPDKNYHYLEDGHSAWASRLINYIKENSIL